MTVKEMAQRLDGRQYMEEITFEEIHLASENGLVVVTGYSDDNTEFYGAISDEVECFNGRTIYLSADGYTAHFDEYRIGCPGKMFQIEAVWCDPDSNAAWTYRTDIPHETFNIYEGDELFCVGIVFSLDDLKEDKTI